MSCKIHHFHYFSVVLSEMYSDRNKNSCTTKTSVNDTNCYEYSLFKTTISGEILYARNGAKCFTYITSFNIYYNAIIKMRKW